MSSFSREESEACRALVSLALTEDLGSAGDRTTLATIPAHVVATAAFVARIEGVLAGMPAAVLTAQAVDPSLIFQIQVPEGARLTPNTTLATVSGSLRSILAVERTALNFLQRLSGIATLTRSFVDAAAGTHARILDTRKTTPGWRRLEKYAVRMGGGTNHRMGLHDGILIKDNHLAGLGGDLTGAVRAAREYPGNSGLLVEVEVDSLEQLAEALTVQPDFVLLDNMSLAQLRAAVDMRNQRAPSVQLEASGGVTLARLAEIAATGVDRISVGALTHSAPALDIGLDYLSSGKTQPAAQHRP